MSVIVTARIGSQVCGCLPSGAFVLEVPLVEWLQGLKPYCLVRSGIEPAIVGTLSESEISGLETMPAENAPSFDLNVLSSNNGGSWKLNMVLPA